MTRKLFYVLIFLAGILLGSVTTGYFKNREFSYVSQQEKIRYQNKLQENSRLCQAIKTNCPLPASGKMFFGYQLVAADQGQKILTINLDSQIANILADAIDLRLDFDKGIEIVEIINGNSFSLYPRKTIGDGFVLITGVAFSKNNEILFAQPKTTFIKLIIKTNSLAGKSVINFNRQESKIYLSGNDILDLNRTFSRIEL